MKVEMIEVSEREQLLRIYAETRTIAVVGASAGPSKAAHQVPRYLQRQGYRIVPVNPRGGEIFGEPVFRSLAQIDVPVDVVEVFRPAQEAPEIARQAIAIGAKVLWVQIGIVSEEARQIAEAAGLTVVITVVWVQLTRSLAWDQDLMRTKEAENESRKPAVKVQQGESPGR